MPQGDAFGTDDDKDTEFVDMFNNEQYRDPSLMVLCASLQEKLLSKIHYKESLLQIHFVSRYKGKFRGSLYGIFRVHN